MGQKAVFHAVQDSEEGVGAAGASGGSGDKDPEGTRVFNLRMPLWLVLEVDQLRRKRPGKISRNTWILEAIEDKLEREGGGETITNLPSRQS